MELSDNPENSGPSGVPNTENFSKPLSLYSKVLKRPSIRTALGLEEGVPVNLNPAIAVAELSHAKCQALEVGQKTKISTPTTVKQIVSVPMALLDFELLSPKHLDAFLHPVLMDLEYYQTFWTDLVDMHENCFPVAVTGLVLEYDSFIYSCVENHTLFYFSEANGQSVRKKIDIVLLETFATFKTIEAGFPGYLVPLGTMHELFLEYGIKTLNIAMGIIDNPFDGSIPKQIKQLLKQVENYATVRGINDLQARLEDFIEEQLLEQTALFYRTHQLTLLAEKTIKLGFGFISLVREYMKSQKIDGMPNNYAVFKLTGHHYSRYSAYLQNTVRPKRPLSLPEIVQIINLTSHLDIFEVSKGIVPSCSYFCGYLMDSKKFFLPEMWKAVTDALGAEEQRRIQSLEDLIEAEAEEALRTTPAGKQKKPVKSKGRGKKPVKRIAAKKSTAVPKTRTTTDTTTAPTRISEPIDERERQFAILVVGEYLSTRLLRPVLVSIGMSPESWSWSRLTAEIESNLNTRLSSRKHFLMKSIEWVRKRNEIAHPKIDWFNDISFLWDDLKVLNDQLGVKRAKEIRKLLTSLKVPKPQETSKPLNLFGRPDLGITSEVTEKTLSAMRLCQLVLDSTVSKECQENSIEPTLPRLKTWRTCLPFLTKNTAISDDLMDAVVGLLGIRNELAHPSALPQMVRTLIENCLPDHPDYGAFLSRLAKRDQ